MRSVGAGVLDSGGYQRRRAPVAADFAPTLAGFCYRGSPNFLVRIWWRPYSNYARMIRLTSDEGDSERKEPYRRV